MTKAINTESIEKATGRSWSDWTSDIDGIGGRDLGHAELAKQILDKLTELEIDSPAWWAQGITVAYEQHTGKRLPGQNSDGTFEVTVSKTIDKPRDTLFAELVSWFESQYRLNNLEPTNARTSQTPVRSYWRCELSDGSRFAASVESSGDKSKLVLTHTKLPSNQQIDQLKVYWTEVLSGLSS